LQNLPCAGDEMDVTGVVYNAAATDLWQADMLEKNQAR
jgi:hypothetical protein